MVFNGKTVETIIITSNFPGLAEANSLHNYCKFDLLKNNHCHNLFAIINTEYIKTINLQLRVLLFYKTINEGNTRVDFDMLYLIQNNSVEIINLHLNNIINSTITRNL